MAKVTIDKLLSKRLEDNKKKTAVFESKELGGDIEVVKIPLDKVLNIIDDGESLSTLEAMARNYELIYECCPILHNKELQSAYEVVEPFDIVQKIFNDNIGEINSIANLILSLYGLDVERLKDTVKK
jgi:hypothetical protein